MKTLIIIGDAGYPDELNKQIVEKTKGLNITDVKTVGFSSRWNHKTNYVIVTILYLATDQT